MSNQNSYYIEQGLAKFRVGLQTCALLLSLLLVACGGQDTASTTADGAEPAAAGDGGYPDHPIRVIVPFGPGGLADVTVRIAGLELSKSLGQPVVIENRPGAGGVAATSFMLNTEADGYTLIVLTNGTTIAETQFADLPYNIVDDLRPVSALAWFDLVLLTSPDSGLSSLQAVLDHAKSSPNGLRIATINPGSTQQLSAELFKSKAGINATVISYRSTPDVLGALIRKEVDLVVDAYTGLKGAIDGGQAIPIAVTGEVRNPAMPDVPTVAEAGVPDYVVTGWNAIYTHKDTPDAVVAKLNAAIAAVTELPAIQSRFLELGVEARASTPEAMQERLLADIAKWRDVMVSANLAGQ
ncbi:MAG: tripartite tricarboxylate transporter substrate binding protein [Pseudomonadota bacterium]